MFREFTRNHRVVAIDFLGYGDSDAPDVDYSIPLQVSIVKGVLDELGISKADVLGFSMGGWVALKLAAEHPERVKRLVLVGSGGLTFTAAFSEETWVPRTLDEFRRIEALQSDGQLPEFIVRDLLRVSPARAWVYRRSAKSFVSFRDALDGQLTNVRMPVLLVLGKAERVIPFDIALRFQRELPQAKLVGLEGCGHLVLWDCQDRAMPETLLFLQ